MRPYGATKVVPIGDDGSMSVAERQKENMTLYRRHKLECKAGRNNPAHWRCHCPIWVSGVLEGKMLRQSTKTTNKERAEEMLRDAIRNGFWGQPPVSPDCANDIPGALAKWLADAEARKLADQTMKKMGLLARQMEAWAVSHNRTAFADWTTDTARQFRGSWSDGAISARKKLGRMRSFFRFCVESDWMKSNPATGVKPPKVTDPPTLPLDADEMARVYAALARYEEHASGYAFATEHNGRLRPLVMLMANSGLRIGDAVSLEKKSVVGGRLRLYTEKTSVHVNIPLPPAVLAELASLELYRDKYYFWKGEGTLDTACGNYRRSLRRAFRLEIERAKDSGNEAEYEAAKAALGGFHPHRLRDTFAVNLLNSGVALEDVSRLLGHRSISVTEHHYAPWVKSRQDRLEEAVRQTWEKPKLEVVKRAG